MKPKFRILFTAWMESEDERNHYNKFVAVNQQARELLFEIWPTAFQHEYIYVKNPKVPPKTICYCGSLRVALEAFKKAEYQSVLDGNIALLPCCMFVDIQREYGAESDYKIKADELHKRKIDICDEVHVLNVGGYIGESTKSEIEYAMSISKPIFYLENPYSCG